jgi:hypothetical protein
MGAKIPQQSSSRSWGASCGYHILRKLLKNGARNQEVFTPIFIHAHIQLAGSDLTNNHTFKLLSGLLLQTLSDKNIARFKLLVNLKRSLVGEVGPIFMDNSRNKKEHRNRKDYGVPFKMKLLSNRSSHTPHWRSHHRQ